MHLFLIFVLAATSLGVSGTVTAGKDGPKFNKAAWTAGKAEYKVNP